MTTRVTFLLDGSEESAEKLLSHISEQGGYDIYTEHIVVGNAGTVRAETPMVEKGPVVVRGGGRKYGPSFRD
jgi:hypothetical protein